ncbi:scamp family-domain-containing protein [Cladochytrium replicatum]|nr:scamp family-domain-containing protein [Cladochytrium replicatum]
MLFKFRAHSLIKKDSPSSDNPWSPNSAPANTARGTSRPAPPPAKPASSGWGPQARSGHRDREAELAEREERLKFREAQLTEREARFQGFNPPNWPPKPWPTPILYHDIHADIPEKGQWLVKRLYGTWFLAIAGFLCNFIAALGLLIIKAEGSGGTFGLSILILLVGAPVSFVFWYRQLYDGVKHDRSISFFMFFLNFAIYLGAKIIFVIGMPGWGGAGAIYAMQAFGENIAVGILCIISTGVMGFGVLNGIWQIKNAVSYYRTRGMSVAAARNEAVTGFTQSEVGRDLIKSAALGR